MFRDPVRKHSGIEHWRARHKWTTKHGEKLGGFRHTRFGAANLEVYPLTK